MTTTIRRLSTHANVVKQLLMIWSVDIMAYEKQFQLRQISQRVDPCSHYVADMFRDMIAKDKLQENPNEQREQHETLMRLLEHIAEYPEVVVPFFLKEVLEIPEAFERDVQGDQLHNFREFDCYVRSTLDLMHGRGISSHKTELICALMVNEQNHQYDVAETMAVLLARKGEDFSEAVAFALYNPYLAFTYARDFDPNDAHENAKIASNLGMVLGFLSEPFEELYNVVLPRREVGRKHKNRLAWLDEAAKTARFAKPLVVRVHEMVQLAYP